jgi:DNA repair exonuclease SbcCD ATPase subunit
MSPKFGFFKRKTFDTHGKKSDASFSQAVTGDELLKILDKKKKSIEKDLSMDLEPARNSVLDCLDRLRKAADELDEKEIKVESPQFESLISTSKNILITSIKKESFIESSEINSYDDAVKFKNNLELLINRFGQVGDSHNRILNEFMHRQISKLKSEFDNLSHLLKDVKKIISAKESEITKCTACKEDLISLKEKSNEKKDKQERLTELLEEKQTIDKNIESSKSEYIDFQKSYEFLNTSSALEKINDKKKEIAIFEKNMINMISNLSRPITKFSYNASKETQGKLATLMNQPLQIFDNNSQYIELLNGLKKQVTERSIQIKDPEKTIHQIDEITSSMPSLSSKLKNLKDELTQLESSVNSKNMNRLEDIKNKVELYEKYRLENISMTDEIRNNVEDLDSAIKTLKEKIEDSVLEITQTRYSISQSSN